MDKSNNTGIFLHTAILLFLSTLFFSCDTEYVDKINDIPGDVIKVPGYTQIESFTFKDTENNAVNAAITEENILFTWSNYMAIPETIKPEIVLGTEATISPASGAEVPFKDGTVYTVTSKAGTTKKYTIKIDIRQKEPKSWTYNSGDFLNKGFLQRMINNESGNGIDNLWLSLKDTRVYFVAATDQKTEYTAEIAYLGVGGLPLFPNYGVYYFLPENMPEGKYDMRIKNGAFILQNTSVDNRFKVEVAEPDYFSVERYGSPVEKQIGETFELRGGMMNTITAAVVYNNKTKTQTYPLEIVSITPYRAVLKVSIGVPPGLYDRIKFTTTDGSSILSYTVTVK
ncbi:hypothetical protein [Flavobacterium bizetiae]|uniref:hypothetical protein n=1 Tax=Flavobacterium bizetiae TaxID=2704140 RepID=UPI003757009B